MCPASHPPALASSYASAREGGTVFCIVDAACTIERSRLRFVCTGAVRVRRELGAAPRDDIIERRQEAACRQSRDLVEHSLRQQIFGGQQHGERVKVSNIGIVAHHQRLVVELREHSNQ